MTRRNVKTSSSKLSTSLADEKIQQLAEQLLEAIEGTDKDKIEEFSEFEQKVLEVGNEVCRQAIKKNSRK
jgi:hypothetical protein